MLEGQVLQLVLDLLHPESVRDRGVDVQRLLRNDEATVLRHVVQRPHVVQSVGQLHQDDPDVVHHGEQHLAKVLGLPLRMRREGDRADLRDPLDHVRHLGAEQFRHALDRGQGVLDNIVEQTGRDRDVVQPHVRHQSRHLERVGDIRFARAPFLAGVLRLGELECAT